MVSKRYEGERTIDGIHVTVNGAPLPDLSDIKKFTDHGFEWSYEGASPQQLAFAILTDFLDDSNKAAELSEPFMKNVIANLDNDWALTGSDVSKALGEIEKA